MAGHVCSLVAFPSLMRMRYDAAAGSNSYCHQPLLPVAYAGSHGSGYQSSSQQTSYMRSSQQNWGRPSSMSSFVGGAADSSRRTTRMDSIAGAWVRPSSSMAGSTGEYLQRSILRNAMNVKVTTG